jgi:hypothetical protein
MSIAKYIIPLFIGIACIIYIRTDARKRNMSLVWALLGFFNLIGLIIYLIVRKPLVNKQHINSDLLFQDKHLPNDVLTIPDTCPHCKNPNTKKIRLCEWCGGQIV